MKKHIVTLVILLSLASSPPAHANVYKEIGKAGWRAIVGIFKKSPKKPPAPKVIPKPAPKISLKSLNIPAALTQEAVSQAVRIGMKTGSRSPISPPRNTIFIKQSERIAEPTKKWLTLGGATQFVAGGILTNAIWAGVANALGLEEAPVPQVQQAFEAEIAGALEAGEKRYYIKACVEKDIIYGLPSDAINCVWGGEIQYFEEPLDLDEIRKISGL